MTVVIRVGGLGVAAGTGGRSKWEMRSTNLLQRDRKKDCGSLDPEASPDGRWGPFGGEFACGQCMDACRQQRPLLDPIIAGPA